MENLEINHNFWKGKSVFITGHTGFKGGWLSLWLTKLGAKVHGFSLSPEKLSFHNSVNIQEVIKSSTFSNILNIKKLNKAFEVADPSFVFHLAAQPLVIESFKNPVETFSTNFNGTLNLLEILRNTSNKIVLVNITSDKCYKNNNTGKPYIESDPLGGDDPYSSSKACSEILTNSYTKSFFKKSNVIISTVRAGNVIGGGDWAKHRIVPDIIRAFKNGNKLELRNPNSTRPWQHVLEPISGYIKLAQKMYITGEEFSGAWNFGPNLSSSKNVKWIFNEFSKYFPNFDFVEIGNENYIESKKLSLNIDKSKKKLKWFPLWDIKKSIFETAVWYKRWMNNENLYDYSLSQISNYTDHLNE